MDSAGKVDEIAILVTHKKITTPYTKYLTTIDYIEAVTGLDFFSLLKKSVEGPLESKKAVGLW